VVGEKVSHLKVSDLTDQKLSESPFDGFAAKSYQIRKWYDSCWRWWWVEKPGGCNLTTKALEGSHPHLSVQ